MIPEHETLIGSRTQDLDTPTVLVDLDLVEANISKMFAQFVNSKVTVRPHLKTVKSPFFAALMIEAGAKGVCVAKLGEAEIMADAGIEDILITTELIGREKLLRLSKLLANFPNSSIKVVVDSREGALALSEMMRAKPLVGLTLDCLIEINVGQNRCGTAPGEETLELSRFVDALGGLKLVGVQGYEGHLQHLPAGEREKQCLEAMATLEYTVNLLREQELTVPIVTTGGTGTALVCARSRVVTEVQPGSFIFMDTAYNKATNGAYANALTVLTSVISKTSGRVVVDAGTKSLSTDMGNAAAHSLPHLQYRPGGDEHGILERLSDFRESQNLNQNLDPSTGLPAIGDKIEMVPSHIDTTVNLHDMYFCHRRGIIEKVIPISARGKVQ